MYDFVDGFGVSAEDVSEDLVEVVLLSRLGLIVILDPFNKALGDHASPPFAPVDGPRHRLRTSVEPTATPV